MAKPEDQSSMAELSADDAYRQWQEVSERYVNFGAFDTEAREAMCSIKEAATKGQPYPESENLFGILTDTEDGEANKALNEAGRIYYQACRLENSKKRSPARVAINQKPATTTIDLRSQITEFANNFANKIVDAANLPETDSDVAQMIGETFQSKGARECPFLPFSEWLKDTELQDNPPEYWNWVLSKINQGIFIYDGAENGISPHDKTWLSWAIREIINGEKENRTDTPSISDDLSSTEYDSFGSDILPQKKGEPITFKAQSVSQDANGQLLKKTLRIDDFQAFAERCLETRQVFADHQVISGKIKDRKSGIFATLDTSGLFFEAASGGIQVAKGPFIYWDALNTMIEMAVEQGLNEIDLGESTSLRWIAVNEVPGQKRTRKPMTNQLPNKPSEPSL